MTKLYTYLILLCFAFIGRSVFAQCPPEPLLVEFEAYEVKQDLQVAGYFSNTQVASKLKVLLANWLNTDVDLVLVDTTVMNQPPRAHDKGNFYTYCNAKDGVNNTYTYSGGGQSGTCPVVIKVLDKYHPNCGKKPNTFNPNFPKELEISTCSPTKEQLDEFFVDVAQQVIKGSVSWGDANWNDIMYQTPSNMACQGSGIKEAYIDWENTDISSFRLDGKSSDFLQIQYVLLDKAGNKGLRYKGDVLMPCRTKIKIKRSNFDVDFACPDYSVLSNTEVKLDLPKVPDGEYITWTTTLTISGLDKNKNPYAWTAVGDGISVSSFPKEGVYKITLGAKVCNYSSKSVSCPINVIKQVERCDPK